MRKSFYISAAALLCSGMLAAQTPANRTPKTIVADVLAQMPVAQQGELNKLMADLSAAGEDGIAMLIDRLVPPGAGDNTRVDYALSGLTHYLSSQGRENERKAAVNAYLKGLERVQNADTKAFIIRQLQLLGGDECVEPLAGYLHDRQLGCPAAEALAAIGTASAGQALTAALKQRMGTPETQADIVQAIGEAGVADAEDTLLALLGSTSDAGLRRTLLYALGQTGSAKSLDALAQAAEADGYRETKEQATDAYLALLRRIVELGEAEQAEKAASQLLKKAGKAGEQRVEIAALQVLLMAQEAGEGNRSKMEKEVLKAMDEGDGVYRNAVLAFASPFADAELYAGLARKMEKADADLKADLLNWIGREAGNPFKRIGLQNLELSSGRFLGELLEEQLADTCYRVREATVRAIAALRDQSSIPVLAALLRDGNKQTVRLAQSALSSFPGSINVAVAGEIPLASEAGKVAGLQLLAGRKAVSGLNTVLQQIRDGSGEVRKTAYEALKDVVEYGDFGMLCRMLEQSDAESAPYVQRAMNAALASQPAEACYLAIVRSMEKAGGKDYLYYPVLAETRLPQAVETIVQGFRNQTGEKREAAFNAMLVLTDKKVADELYKICQEGTASKYYQRAFDAYLKYAGNPQQTGENRLLNLRKAMEVAQTDKGKNQVLKEVEKTGTFLGMIYAGQFLEQKPVQQSAANAVMNIALAHKEYAGDNVRKLLEKVMEVLDNPDARYQKEGIRKYLAEMPAGEGFVSLFNGKDLTGWKGLVANPIERAKMTPAQLAKAQAKADENMRRDWKVENGLLVFDGKGYDNLCTVKQYGDFEMYVDWMLDPAGPEADAGIYLRGTPQVQIWDTARVNVGAQVGSGGLYNNVTNPSKPLKVADNALGEWNSFYIKMVGDRVTVLLNGVKVVDDVILENYWNRRLPIFPIEQIELQAHGSKVYYRDIYVKELEREEPFKLPAEEEKEGFEILFDGTNMHEWTGNTVDYTLENQCISMNPSKSFGGNLYTKKEYGDFVLRFDFQLTPGANNGVGIRTPMEGDAAYVGMEVQILDCEHPIYKDITPLQHHGSVYGIIPALPNHTEAMKPAGEWNSEEILADGDHIRVTVNGVVILDGNIREATKNGTADGHAHPGLFNKKGHIGFLGHGSPIKFRNIRIKELNK